MKLPVNCDVFGKIIQNRLDFVDKSLFIKEFIDANNIAVTVITRPRGFGKTFNLSMLHHFLAAEVNGSPTKELFNNLKITTVDNGKYLQYQGQSPVIFISFKDIKGESFSDSVEQMKACVQKLYEEYLNLLQSDALDSHDKDIINKYLQQQVTLPELECSIISLSQFLYQHYKKHVYILVDAYDTPIQISYFNNYYESMILFIGNMLGAALKSNDYLERGIMTGIMIPTELISSHLNNVTVESILSSEYSEHFGFTAEEVLSLLEQANLSDKSKEIKKWYNGYVFGNTMIYNPYSITNCVQAGGKIEPYWINTSDNDLIKDLLIQNKLEFREKLELLLQNQTITSNLNKHTTLLNLQKNYIASCGSLAMSGYLKVVKSHLAHTGKKLGQLAIPNLEIHALYSNIIKNWLSNDQGAKWYDSFLKNLLNGETENFDEELKEILVSTTSYHDAAQQPEAFYHGFLLGLIASLDKGQYEIKSNKESAQGRYSILILSKEPVKPSIILELKSVKDTDNLSSKLIEGAKESMEKLNRIGCVAELQKLGVTNIIKLGVAFSGKDLRVCWKQ
jgi:hypothetical protein